LSAAAVDTRFKFMEQTFNLGLKWRLSERTVVGYDLYYDLQEETPSNGNRTILSNSVDISHAFNKILTGSARYGENDRNDKSLNFKEYTRYFNAGLAATYLETFAQTLSYSGNRVTQQSGSNITFNSSFDSLMLRNVAQLYSGVNVSLDVGYSRNTYILGNRDENVLTRIFTSITPNDKISLNVNYSLTNTKEYKREITSKTRSQTLDASVYYVPLKNLSLAAQITANDQRGSTTTYHYYSVNWSPFPGGGLQLSFFYNETYFSEEKNTQTSYGPFARLEINRRVFLDASYQFMNSDSVTQKSDLTVFNSNLRLLF